MRHTVVTTVTAAILIAALVGMPSSAQSQVVIIIGNGAAQPNYPPPYPYPYSYPHPYPHNRVVYGEAGYYSAYGYVASGNGYYNGYNPYYNNGYYRPYGYGW
jgi:hypothetical protein